MTPGGGERIVPARRNRVSSVATVSGVRWDEVFGDQVANASVTVSTDT